MSFKKVFTILCILFLFSCSEKNNLIFLSESFFWEVIENNGRLAEGLADVAKTNNFIFKNVISNEDHLSVLEVILQNKNNSVVILSPFMNNLAINIAEQYKEHLFILFGNIIDDELPANLLVVTFDRTATYREAGVITVKTIKSVESSFNNIKIGIIVSNISRQTEAEIDAFKLGVLEIVDESFIVERVLSNYNDHVLIRDAIESMRDEGALYFLLKVFQSNTYSLEILKNSGGYAIVEDWAGIGGYEEQVILSVEEDYIETIAYCLLLIEQNSGKIHWKNNRINGIVKLE